MAFKRGLATLYATYLSLNPLPPPSPLRPLLLAQPHAPKTCKHCVFQKQNQPGDLWIFNRAQCCVPPGPAVPTDSFTGRLIGGAMPADQGRPAPKVAAHE